MTGDQICRAQGMGRMAQKFFGVICASYSSQDRDAGGRNLLLPGRGGLAQPRSGGSALP